MMDPDVLISLLKGEFLCIGSNYVQIFNQERPKLKCHFTSKKPHDSCMTFTPSPEPRSTTTQQQRCCRLTFQRAQPLSGPGIKTAATKEKKPLIYR